VIPQSLFRDFVAKYNDQLILAARDVDKACRLALKYGHQNSHHQELTDLYNDKAKRFQPSKSLGNNHYSSNSLSGQRQIF